VKTITINRPKYRDQEVGDEFQINYQRYRVTKQFRGKNGMTKGCLHACPADTQCEPQTSDPVLIVYDEIMYRHAVSNSLDA